MWDRRLRGEGQVRAAVEAALLAQRGSLIGWVPVCLGIGVGTYFSLGSEPDLLVMVSMGIGVFVALICARMLPTAFAPLLVAVALILAGITVAKYRVTAVEAPILNFRYYGPIEGRVVNIDRSASDAVRLTLDRVVLARMAPDRTPGRVRVSLHGDQPLQSFTPGDVLILTGHLSPPAGPAEPGGFDFQRHAWFLQLGAVGYTRTPVLRLSVPNDPDIGTRLFAMRMAISQAVQKAMPGEPGAFAAAIMTGDRSAIGQATLTDLRTSNLAHLLAISGLHMGLLTGFIFAFVRYGLALIPGVALRWPTKKIAAICALCVGAFYLALSGGSVSTERAYIMVAVMFVAVLLGRRALTLRAVAMAAILVLLWQPEALIGPGFQMSFAATTALVAVFGALRRFDFSRWPRWSRAILSVVLSSFIAGLATAPFAAAHFNQIAHYGLIANVLSVPLMGVLVMPAAVLAVCLAPFGLWSIGLWLMEIGLRWILFVAATVSAREGALGHVWAPDWYVLPILSLGLLWIVLVAGRGKIAGALAVICAGVLWHQTERPALLIADSGSLIGLSGAEGRILSKPTGNGFVAGIWLENDGAPVPQVQAASRDGLRVQGRVIAADLGDWRVLQVSGKTALADLVGCDGADVLISNQVDAGARPCLVYDVARFRNTGALALNIAANGDLLIETAHHVSGQRPWNSRQGDIPDPMRLSFDQRKRAADATLLTQNQPDQ
ncbi:ComEC/Rec2 family competence protein [Roseobacter sp. CCS2]|uniref:ComEC/Rec2 family competence protein n=1 Tax=Roseobacter sp. CCS2 TaxID=391593 RepID=UPI0000F3C4FA|nr:ComEC/Rec2 family competence protein [Roseobacter sp. CCS2]EBA11704.1 competence protein, putative [Roseobacter sp. CCS2]